MPDVRPEDFGATPVQQPAKAVRPEDFGGVPVAADNSQWKTPQHQGMEHTLPPIPLGAPQEPGIDYGGIHDTKLHAEASFASNPNEQKAVYEKKFGQGNVYKDKYGAWIVSPQGLKKAGIDSMYPKSIQPAGSTPWSSYAGEVFPFLLGTVGGTAGAVAGPGGSIGGAALGTAAGSAVNHIIKDVLGFNQEGAVQTAKDIAKSSAIGAASEAGGQAAMGLGRFALRPYGPGSMLGTVPPETASLTREALSQGMVPRVSPANPKAIISAKEQSIRENIFGFGPEKSNMAILKSKIDNLIHEASSGAKPLTDAELNAKLVQAANDYRDSTVQVIDMAMQKATKLVNRDLSSIDQKLSKGAGGTDLASDIRAAHEDFQTSASALYQKVDELSGGKPIIPTARVKAAAQEVLNALPKTAEGTIALDSEGVGVKYLQNLTKLPDTYTAAQMQALRRQLAQFSVDGKSLLATVGERNGEILRSTADKSFDDAMTYMKTKMKVAPTSVSGILRGRPLEIMPTSPQEAKPIVEALRKADTFYREGIQKFDLPIIKQLTAQARNNGFVPPEKVVALATRNQNATALGNIMRLVKPETQQAIRSAHFRSLIEQAMNPADDTVSGQALLNRIKAMKSTFPALYGKDAPEIISLGRKLAALKGSVDPKVLESGDVKDAIKSAIEKQQAYKAYMDKNYLHELTKPDFEPSKAAAYLMSVDRPNRIRQVLQHFGENSTTSDQLRGYAMRKILGSMEAEKGPRQLHLTDFFKGAPLKAELNRVGRPSLEAMFGKDVTDRLFRFADVATHVTSENPSVSGIVSAMLVSRPIHYAHRLLDVLAFGSILNKGAFLKWITDGLEAKNTRKVGTALTRLFAMYDAAKGQQPDSGGQGSYFTYLKNRAAKGAESAGGQIKGILNGGSTQAPSAPQTAPTAKRDIFANQQGAQP